MIGAIVIGIAAVLGVVPASLALDQGKPAGTGVNPPVSVAVPIGRVSVDRQAVEGEPVSVAMPIGRVSVDPRSVEGDPVYVRRTSAIGGMAIVEVSTTPFVPAVRSNEQIAGVQGTVVRSDQPAGW